MMSKEGSVKVNDHRLSDYEYVLHYASMNKKTNIAKPTFKNKAKAKKQMSDIKLAKELLNL